MKYLNLKRLMIPLVIISFLIFYILRKITPMENPSLVDHAKTISTVLTIDGFIVLLFIRYLWRWKGFRAAKLVLFPDLNGTYKGTIQTTWEGSGERTPPIPATLTIHQMFTSVSCVMRTAEMTSHSLVSGFILDEDEQLKKLAYSYLSSPSHLVIERSPCHHGTALFEIEEKPKLRLVGQYWTGRKTTGTIEMKFWKKDKITTFPSDLGEHPVSAAETVRADRPSRNG